MQALGTSTIWQVRRCRFWLLFITSCASMQIQPAVLTRSTLDGSPLAVPQQPHVQPQYYAAIVAAEAIGHSGQTQATELIIDDARISGYAFYESGALKRAVFINSLAFLQGATNRTSAHLDLSFSGTGTKPTAFSVKRLVIGCVSYECIFSLWLLTSALIATRMMLLV